MLERTLPFLDSHQGRFNFGLYGNKPYYHMSLRFPTRVKELETILGELEKEEIISFYRIARYREKDKTRDAYETGSKMALVFYKLRKELDIKIDSNNFKKTKANTLLMFQTLHSFFCASGIGKHIELESYNTGFATLLSELFYMGLIKIPTSDEIDYSKLEVYKQIAWNKTLKKMKTLRKKIDKVLLEEYKKIEKDLRGRDRIDKVEHDSIKKPKMKEAKN